MGTILLPSRKQLKTLFCYDTGHHTAILMVKYMAVQHPHSWISHGKDNIHILASRHINSIFPDFSVAAVNYWSTSSVPLAQLVKIRVDAVSEDLIL